MEYNGIKIKITKICDYNYDDSIKLIFKDIENNSEIGYIVFKEHNYDYEFSENYDGIEITNIVEEYEPMSIDYIEIYENYKQQGFGTFIMNYFVKKFMKDNVCILLKCAFGITDESVKQFMNNYLLLEFYKKFGFVQLPNSNYMVANLY